MIPTEDVLRVAKDTLALIGNASWSQFISSMTAQRPAVAKFLTKDTNCGSGSELFGPDVHKKVTDRADTFNKAVSKVEGVSKQTSTSRVENHFLSKRPAAYRSRSGRETSRTSHPTPTEADTQDHNSGEDKENTSPRAGTIQPPTRANKTSRAEGLPGRSHSDPPTCLEKPHQRPLGLADSSRIPT